MLVANSSSREERLLQGCHRVPPQILKKRKRNLRRDSACQRTEVKGAVPINGIGMSQAPRSRTAKPRGSGGVQSVASVPRLRESAAALYRFLCFRPRRCSGLWLHAALFWSCGSAHAGGWNLFHCRGLCDCVHGSGGGLFGTSTSSLVFTSVVWIWNSVFQFCPSGGQFSWKSGVYPCSYGRFWLLAPRLLVGLGMKNDILRT